ncbi:DUF6455 family protein [Ancylobacter radicis]|uniref:DUF6455 domain-containing protein n=1 Tax=Ancylobacter radicis TaxID=2836179 RepID=A0ABS5R4J3_9HYPH|nr:DUF6455 family protein [Ancylobacter radicis]MBS9476590.1 hypothetical protein [Ancylobacter radicis]
MQVDTIDERLALFRTMMEHAGLDPEAGLVPDAELRAAAERCLGCRDAGLCHDWMAETTVADPVAEFCRNAPHFARWVEEIIARELAANGAGAAAIAQRP